MRYRAQADDEDEEVLDMSIVGDEEEQHRIELEHNLQDLSIQLSLSTPSSASDADVNGGMQPRLASSESSLELEFPRHNPHPRDTSIFDGHGSVYPFGTGQEQEYSFNHLSRHSFDDEDAAPYLGHTKSSMAHHASAVTLSAGLRPQRHRSLYGGDASLSGAEYDPDRPLDNVLNGMANDLSMLNMGTPRVQRKHRTALKNAGPSRATFDPIVPHDDAENSRSFAKLRAAAKQDRMAALQNHHLPIHRARPTQRTAVQERPLTPSTGNGTGGSKFTKLAKSLAKEIEASQRWVSETAFEPLPGKRKSARQQARRNPLHDVANHPNASYARSAKDEAKTVSASHQNVERHKHGKASTVRSNAKDIVLPDVTGLTSIIGSPVRPGTVRRPYLGGNEGEHVEEQLLHTLTSLQTRLNQLESQNLVSRRRVRELELELDACKAEVKRERTRVLEREQIIVAQQKDFQKRRATSNRPVRIEEDVALDDRYNEVLEEKKALEALIGTLRSHLARLTEELSSQQTQLDDLRSMRESDIQNLRDKIMEVDNLKLEVERLGGEVEILRGVVEEGLKERRRVKEAIESADSSIGSASKFPPTDESAQQRPDNATGLGDLTYERSRVEIPSPPPSRPQSPQLVETRAGRFIDEDELDRVSADLEERRSERSLGNSCNQSADDIQVHNPPIKQSEPPRTKSSRHLKQENAKECVNVRVRINDAPSPKQTKVYAKTPARVSTRHTTEEGTPFPQIRGTRLERLFFSAPEHNAKTCRVCHGRRRPSEMDDELDFPSWLPPRKRPRFNTADGRSNRHENNDHAAPMSRAPFAEDRLPPQTVLVRVLRELEDDFTHYKGIYVELADQYKIIDAASNVVKRNVLAEHLKEVIETLEQKGDQIASLYDLLAFKDKPTNESAVPQRSRKSRPSTSPHSSRQSGSRHNVLRKYATYS